MAAKTNSEGNLYEANWKKFGRQYVAWLKRLPKEKVQGSSEEELVEQLWEIALDAYGDGEACIDLSPPFPVTRVAAGYFDPSWFRFSCNEGFHPVGDSRDLYRQGLCSFCRAGLGGRNETERVIDRSLKGDLGFVWGALPAAAVVSDAFLRFFRPLLGKAIRAVPCKSVRPSKKRMWELELAGDVALVCHRKGTHAGGVVCPKCSTARFGPFVYEPIQKGQTYAIARSAVEKIRAPAAIVVAGYCSEIVVVERLAKRVKKSFEGVLLDRLAILPDVEIGKFDIRKLKKSEV